MCIPPIDCVCAKGKSGDDCGTAICTNLASAARGTARRRTTACAAQGSQCEVANAACCFTRGAG
jgi:hypothetical protein